MSCTGFKVPLTAQQVIDKLKEFPPDTPVVVSVYNGCEEVDEPCTVVEMRDDVILIGE